MSDENPRIRYCIHGMDKLACDICKPPSELAPARGYTAPLSGEWRCSGDIICCGTLRIAVLDIDTQPSDEFKAKLGAWMCRTMNEAQYNGKLTA